MTPASFPMTKKAKDLKPVVEHKERWTEFCGEGKLADSITSFSVLVPNNSQWEREWLAKGLCVTELN